MLLQKDLKCGKLTATFEVIQAGVTEHVNIHYTVLYLKMWEQCDLFSQLGAVHKGRPHSGKGLSQCRHFADKGESIFSEFVRRPLWTAPYLSVVFAPIIVNCTEGLRVTGYILSIGNPLLLQNFLNCFCCFRIDEKNVKTKIHQQSNFKRYVYFLKCLQIVYERKCDLKFEHLTEIENINPVASKHCLRFLIYVIFNGNM